MSEREIELKRYLAGLRAQGVQLTVEVREGQEKLKVSAPQGGMRPRMVAAIRKLQGEILQHGYWWREGDNDEMLVWWGRCAKCGALVRGAGTGMEPPAPGTAMCVWCWASDPKRSKRS